jgi:TolB protein
MTQPSVFISYSHADEKEKDALLTHLGILEQAGLIDLWSDDRIGAGSNWAADIDQAISQANVAILLISANLLTTDFILTEELPKLLKRHAAGGLVVFPVIAKPCAWQEIDWLARLEVRPKNGAPVWRDNGLHADEELSRIAGEVARLIKGVDRPPAVGPKNFPFPQPARFNWYIAGVSLAVVSLLAAVFIVSLSWRAGTVETTPTRPLVAATPSPRTSLAVSLTGRIAFASDREGNWDIYVMNADGSGEPRNLTKSQGEDHDPAWSPDGRFIAFQSKQDDDEEIYVVEVDSLRQPKPLTHNEANDYHAAWSPDGQLIAFTSEQDGNEEIYTMRADGSSEPLNLTKNPFDDNHPTWSPDGRFLAFASERDNQKMEIYAGLNKAEIYMMTADGADPIRKTGHVNGAYLPAWSPDGRYIAFIAYRERDRQPDIYMIDLQDTETIPDPIRLTSQGRRNLSPAWAALSSQYLFFTRTNEQFSICVLDVKRGDEQIACLPNTQKGDEVTWWAEGLKLKHQP